MGWEGFSDHQCAGGPEVFTHRLSRGVDAVKKRPSPWPSPGVPGEGKRARVSLRELADVDVLEPEGAAVVLQFDLSGGVDGFVALPVVFEGDVIDDELVVEPDGDFVADHADVEG